jgi:hypothetical protein
LTGSTQWTRWAVVLLGLVMAVVLGYWIGAGQRVMVGLALGGGLGLVLAIGLRQQAWILILVCWHLTGSILLLPLPFSLRELGILTAAAVYFLHRAVSKRVVRPPWHPIDLIVLVNLVYLVLTFLHNPVGFWLFRAERVGARAYFNIALAALAGWVIFRLPESARGVPSIPLYLMVGAVVTGLINAVGYLAPPARQWLYALYSELDTEGIGALAGLAEIVRFKGLAMMGQALLLVLCAYSPPRLLFHPLRSRFYLLLLALACVLVSGYRSSMAWAMGVIVISAIYRGGWRELLAVGAVGGLLLGLVVAGQGRLYQLPLSAQRTLSFLPGQWSYVVLEDAEASTHTRLEWWKNVIEHGYIQNWILGDGFGGSARDMLALTYTDPSAREDLLVVSGAFHSGPFTTIRYTGLIGLVLIYALMFALVVTSYRLFHRVRGTELEPSALFVAAQVAWFPIHFTLIFGAYNVDMPALLILTGLLRLLLRVEPSRPPLSPADSPARA